MTYSGADSVGAMAGTTKSGLLGLGWPLSAADDRSFWSTSMTQTAWPVPQMGIYLARELDRDLPYYETPGGKLTLG